MNRVTIPGFHPILIPSMSIITLTTDFGLSDWFVGTMKGVIASIAPDVRVIDITHGIRQGQVREGAFALAAAARYFPEGTIHVGVIDPGVGSSRHALAVECHHQIYIAPDNGLLSAVVPDGAPFRAYRLENDSLFLPTVSQTFHGRDVFAPVAAHLARGLPLTEVGPATDEWERLTLPGPVESFAGLCGEVVYIDQFGNALSSFPAELAANPGTVQLPDGTRTALVSCYADVDEGDLLAVAGSTGFIEVAIRNGSAAVVHQLEVGDPLILSAKK